MPCNGMELSDLARPTFAAPSNAGDWFPLPRHEDKKARLWGGRDRPFPRTWLDPVSRFGTFLRTYQIPNRGEMKHASCRRDSTDIWLMRATRVFVLHHAAYDDAHRGTAPFCLDLFTHV